MKNGCLVKWWGLPTLKQRARERARSCPQINSILLKKCALLPQHPCPWTSNNSTQHWKYFSSSFLYQDFVSGLFKRLFLKWKILICVGELLGHQGQSLISLFDRWHEHQIKATYVVLVVLEVRENIAVFLVHCLNVTWPGGFLANETGERKGRTWQIQPGWLTTTGKRKGFVPKKLLE